MPATESFPTRDPKPRVNVLTIASASALAAMIITAAVASQSTAFIVYCAVLASVLIAGSVSAYMSVGRDRGVAKERQAIEARLAIEQASIARLKEQRRLIDAIRLTMESVDRLDNPESRDSVLLSLLQALREALERGL